jgi:hypothetical protein
VDTARGAGEARYLRIQGDSLDGTRRVLGTSGHGCGGGFLDEESIPVQLRGADAGCTRNRDIRDFAIVMYSMDCYAMTMRRQCGFEFRTWGGTRKGAGRKRVAARPQVPHRPRERVNPRHPMLVTTRVMPDVARLRTDQMYRAIGDAMAMASKWMYEGEAFRIVHASVQGGPDRIHG